MPEDPNIGEYIPTIWHDYDVPAIDANKLNKIELAMQTAFSYLSSTINTSVTSTFDSDIVLSTQYGGTRIIRFKDADSTFNVSILAKDGTNSTYPGTVGLFDYNYLGGKYAWYYDSVAHKTYMGPLDLTNNRITGVATPIAGADAATKDYVDSRGGTIDWVDSVKSLSNNPPGTPGDGDRYIVGTVPTGAWVGHANEIAQYSSNSLTWTFPGVLSEGCTAWKEDDNKFFTWNGTAWGGQDTYSSHNSLAGLQGGAANDYYHLTSAQVTGLTGGANTSLHKHDDKYLGISAQATDSDKLDGKHSAATATADTVALRDGSGDLYATNFRGALVGNVTGNVSGSSGSTTGNAATATKWQTARTITLDGDVSGSASGVDGSGNVTITTTVADDSHTHDTRYYTETESDAKYATVSKASGTLTAAAGWYRIAASPVDEGRCSGIFDIDWTTAGRHGRATVAAGIHFAADPSLTQLAYSNINATGITKVRIVYHPTYTGNYAYLEVFNVDASALPVTVQLIDGKGWTLQTPEAGSVPSGYTVSELALDEGIATNGMVRVQPYSSSAAAFSASTPFYQRANWLWNGTAYVNNTAEANLPGNATFDYINAIGEYMYIGSDEPFYQLKVDVQTAGVGYTSVFEYFNGSVWADITPTSAANVNNFAADGTITWAEPTGWTAKAFSASDPHTATPPSTTAYYWLRIGTSTTPSTTAKIYAITPFVYTGKFLSFSRETGEVFSVSSAGALVCNGCNFSNGAMTGVNSIVIGDPGGHEGLSWAGGNLWDIFESPDDASNNSGDLQFFQSTTRRFTIRTTGVVDSPGGFSTAGVITSTKATGTAPFTIASTTVVPNLNASLLEGHPASDFALSSGAGYLPLDGGALTGIVTTTSQIQSTLATGTAPFTVASTTKVANLNASLLDGHPASDFALSSGAGYLPLSGGDLTGIVTTNSQIQSTLATGTSPFTVASTTKVTNLTADQVDGIHANATATANNLYPLDSTGKFPNSVLYTGESNGLNADLLDGHHASEFALASGGGYLPLDGGDLTGIVTTNSQIQSSVATGTAPFTVASTTTVTNLNADSVDGAHAGTSANNILKLDASGKIANANLYTGTGNSLDADTVDGAHAGTSANNVLKLNSSGKVPVANLPTGTGNLLDADTVDTKHAGTTAGTLLILPTSTQGDILYYNGTNWVNLGAGTSGKYLKTQGTSGNPTWDNTFSGTFSTAAAITSTLATGTAPFTVASTTKVANLNADKLDDMESATANTVSTIVARDGSGNFSAGTITAALSGNASTASAWQTARTLTVSGAETGTVSLKGDADATLTLTVNHNHDSNYLKLTGGTVTGNTSFTGYLSMVGGASLGPSVPSYVTDLTAAPIKAALLSQQRASPMLCFWAISGQKDHLYMAHRQSAFTITSSITPAQGSTADLFDANLSGGCYWPTASLPLTLTIENSGVIEFTDVTYLCIITHCGTNNGQFNLHDWKVEIKKTDDSWMTVMQRTGVNDSGNLLVPLYYKTDATMYVQIKGVRITVNSSDACSWSTGNFGIARLMLVNSRPIGSTADGVGALDVAGGTMYGDVNWAYGVPKIANNTIWHAGNDGTGSALDADLLDGHHASEFALSSGAGYLPLDGSSTMTGQIVSNYAAGAPISVASGAAAYTVTNFNADLLDGHHASEFALASGAGYLPLNGGNLTGVLGIDHQIQSTVATGTAPFTVASTTKVANLNADKLDDMESATANTVSTIVARDASGNFSAGTITATGFSGPLSGNVTGNLNTSGQIASTYASGAPLSLAAGAAAYTVTNLNADSVDGAHAGTSANNVLKLDSSGKVPNANLYTGTGNSLDADSVDGAHAGTAANNVLKLDSNAKVPVANLPTGTGNSLDADTVDTKHAGTTAGTLLVLPASTQGDILYFNGTNWVSLGAGTSGSYLKTQGTSANPVWDDSFSTAHQITSTLADGTAPFSITSTTKVANLNVDRLDDMHASSTYSAGTASIVSRDTSGNFSAGTITATLSGNASTASAWQTARTLTVSGAETGSVSIKGDAAMTLTLAVNHNHDSSYLKLTGGSLSGTLTMSNGATINMGSARITSLADPGDPQDAATKGYVDALAGGIAWLDPVISKTVTTPPGSPTTGDRYIVPSGATGAWLNQTNKIAQWGGSSWSFTTPTNGNQVFCNADSLSYNYNGSAWVQTSGQVSHQNLTNLQGGTSAQYYHLTSSDYTALRGGSSDATSLHNHAGAYLGLTAKAADSDKLDNMQPATANTVSTIVQRDGSGNFSAGTITATLSGNASTASAWQTARTLTVNGAETGTVSLKGDADATLTLAVNHNHDGSYFTEAESYTDYASLRANLNINGGGTVTYDASGNLLWSARLIVISNGRGTNFGTAGFFDITCPTSGTITGVGGASNATATAAGIPIGQWQALYYILPIGSTSTSVPANFRLASYTTDLDIPAEWVLIAVQNYDSSSAIRFCTGVNLKKGQTYVMANGNDAASISGYVPTTASTASTIAQRDASGNLTAKALISDVATGTAPLTVTSTTKVSNLNADQVDGIHANATATANNLFPLEADGKFPNTVLHTGTGNGLDADTVDGAHAGTAANNVLKLDANGKVPTANLYTGGGGAIDSDTLDGLHGSSYANRSYYSGTVAGAGWYRVAHNGPVATGQTGGDSAYAMFTVRDTAAGNLSSTTFYAGVHNAGNPTLSLVSRSWGASAGGIVTKIRLVSHDAGEGAAVEVYCKAAGAVNFTVYDNEQSSGWTGDNWVSGNLPAGWVATQLDLDTLDPVMAVASANSNAMTVGRDGTITLDGASKVASGASASIRVSNANGYVDIGPQNEYFAHIYTDMPAFYFNAPLQVNGGLVWHAGNDGTGSGLDADLLDGHHASDFALSSGAGYLPLNGGDLTGIVTTNSQIQSSVATGTAPFTVASTTKVANLNVDQVDGIHANSTATANNLYPLDASGKFPNSVLYTGTGNSLDADTVDGAHAGTAANNVLKLDASGKVPVANLPTGTGGSLDADTVDTKHAGTTAGTVLILPTSTRGDILYYNGTNWVSLGAGTSGKYLKTQSTTGDPTWDNTFSGTFSTAAQISSTLATGTAPFSVASTTKVANLNADLLDDMTTATASTVSTIAARDASGNLTAKALVSDVATGTAPLTVTSTTKVSNLNVDQVDGIHANSTATANNLFPLEADGKFPNTVLHTGTGNGLDADTVDGAHAGTAANNVLKLDSGGKVPVGNLPTGAGSTLDADTLDTKHAGTTAGTVLILPTSTRGDILYFNGTNWVSLGAGTSGKYLKTQSTTGDPTWDNTFSTASQITSTLATGTAPFSVVSTTKVANLNADKLDDMESATAATVSTIAARDSNGDLTARRFISGLATGTSPLSVTSTTVNTNLNADMVDGIHANATATANNLFPLEADGKFPNTVLHTGTGNGLDADTVDGAHAGTAANNVLKLDSGGKVPVANLPTGSGSNLDADTVDGAHAGTAANNVLKLDASGKVPNTNLYTGSGNGIDTDKLDGQEGSYYLDLTNASGTLANARMSQTPGFYTFDNKLNASTSAHFTYLGQETVGAMAAVNDWNPYVFDGMAGKVPSSAEYTRNGTDWITVTPSTIKTVFSGMNSGGNISIVAPKGDSGQGGYTGYRITWCADDWSNYYFLRYIYLYTSTNGWNFDVAVQTSQDGTTFATVGTYSAISTWPGHTFISHPAITWSTSRAQYPWVRLLFTPHWDGTDPGYWGNQINISFIKWMADYPGGGVGAKPFTYNFDKTTSFTGVIASTLTTGTAPFTIASTTKVNNLNVDQLDGKHSTDFVLLDGTQTMTGTLTVPTINFTDHTGDPSPVITARTVPAGQGAAAEKTELILFHANDNATGSGVDLITLRAPGIRLQTYSDNTVSDINNANGSNDRLYIDPAGASTFYGTVSAPGLTLTGTLSTNSQIQSTLATGTAPFTVASTTKVANLNADLLDDLSSGSFVRTDADSSIATNVLSFGSATRQMINLYGTTYGIGIQGSTTYIRTNDRFSVHVGGTHSNTENDPGTGGTNIFTVAADAFSYNGNTIWHAGNDGSGSTLDADKLDGMEPATAATVSTIAQRDASGDLTARRLISNVATGTQALGITSTTKVDNLNADYLDGQHLSDLDNRYSSMAKASATTPATIGWYRIAASPSGEDRCSGIFDIDWSLSGYHGRTTLIAEVHFASQPNISILNYSAFGPAGGLTKVRIVYHPTYSGNYAYLEVYLANAAALPISVQLIDGKGWTLQTPSTAGSVPSAYNVIEVPFTEGLSTSANVTAFPAGNTDGVNVVQNSLVNSSSLVDVNAANVYNGAFWNWNGSAYTNNTAESNSSGGTAFNFIATTSSYAYIGSAVPFFNITADVGTAGAGYTLAFQYYNGSTWTSFTPATDGTNDMAQDGTIYWDNLAGWTTLGFSASVPHVATPPDTTGRYWIRISTTTTPSTTATINYMTPSVFTGNLFRGTNKGTELFYVDSAGKVWTSNVFQSAIATGTAPLTVASTTKVANLNAEYVDGYNADINNTASTAVVRDASKNITVNAVSATTGTFSSDIKTSTKLGLLESVGATNYTYLKAGDQSGDITYTMPTAGGVSGQTSVMANNGSDTLSWKRYSSANDYDTIVMRDTSGNFSATTITADLNGNAATATSATQIQGVDGMTVMESLRANVNITGGGTVTHSSGGYLKWSARFIVISNGRGSNFSTSGYFDITCPTSGSITGAGGSAGATATVDGIPLTGWQALYYILPAGSGSGSLPANFRIVDYSADVNVPSTWVLLAARNSDGTAGIKLAPYGVILRAGQSFDATKGAWHGGNDGTGSGLDADTLDGHQHDDFVHEAGDDMSGALTMANNIRIYGKNSTGTQRELAFVSSGDVTYLGNTAQSTIIQGSGSLAHWNGTNNYTIWDSGNDGSGSTLDADMVDGMHATSTYTKGTASVVSRDTSGDFAAGTATINGHLVMQGNTEAISVTLAVEPTDPTPDDGDTYVIPAGGATGANWEIIPGNCVVVYDSNGGGSSPWTVTAPVEGMSVMCLADGLTYKYVGSAWSQTDGYTTTLIGYGQTQDITYRLPATPAGSKTYLVNRGDQYGTLEWSDMSTTEAVAYESINVSYSAIGLSTTFTTLYKYAMITVEKGPVRVRCDGGDSPTNADGHLVYDGDMVYLDSQHDLQKFKAIAVTKQNPGKLRVTYSNTN